MISLLVIGGILLVLFGGVALIGAPYVPSKPRDLPTVFTELYPLGANDVLVDIGSGDGVVLRYAARYGARAIGYELNPILVSISRWLSRANNRISTRCCDFWRTPLPLEVTVCYIFAESRDINRMATRVQQAATRAGRPVALISYGFMLRDYPLVRSIGAHHLYQIPPLHPA